MEVEVIEPHGFCSGVSRAVRLAEECLATAPPANPPYCLRSIVHNEMVSGSLARRGMRFVESLAEVPDGATILFPAHGVAPAVRAEAAARSLNVVDATCPFVERAHRQLRDYAARGIPAVVLGDQGHAEVLGYLGEASVVDPDSIAPGTRVGVVVQTTLDSEVAAESIASLAERFVLETSPAAETCTATRDRQSAVRAFDGDAVLVLGSTSSANTRRLAEIAEASGKRAFRADSESSAMALDFSGIRRLGVTSGASTPESLFSAVLASLRTFASNSR